MSNSVNQMEIGICWPRVWWAGQPPRRILLNRVWAGQWAWAMRPAFLREKGAKRDHLFAGPWVGEFGWELMNWQAHIRGLRPFYRRITVSSRAASAALYADCCDDFVAHDVQGQSNAHVLFDPVNPDELARVLALVPEDADHLVPMRYVPEGAQVFTRFGRPERVSGPAGILIHARGNPQSPDRNWSRENWEHLVDGFKARGLRVGAVGLTSATWTVGGADDYRDIALDELMDRLAAARLVVGPSSGPMHLASLCGAPHLVWTDRGVYGMRKTSREKYERWWNPLRTPVRVLDEHGFTPPVEVVARAAASMLTQPMERALTP